MTVKKEEQTIYVFNVSDCTLLAAAAGTSDPSIGLSDVSNGLSLICLSSPLLSFCYHSPVLYIFKKPVLGSKARHICKAEGSIQLQ
jgi:hypothetical protein